MWSLDEYCKLELLRQSQEDWSKQLPESSANFLRSLNLPTVHPFCEATKLDEFYVEGIPPMGPLLEEEYHNNILDVLITHLYRVLPALLAMGELWLRLFASLIAPVGIAYIIFYELASPPAKTKTTTTTTVPQPPPQVSNSFCMIIILTVAASVVLLTDTLYILEYGPQYGLLLFVVSSMLALRACSTHQLSKTLQCLVLLKLLTAYLIMDGKNHQIISFGDSVDAVTNVPEGLYYNTQNDYIANIVDAWPSSRRTYSKELGATPWMPTGDSRTGLPFLLNKVQPGPPKYHRLWLETHDEEYVALDIALPKTGHSMDKPLYLVLHGLNGGSQEEYVMEFVNRRTAEGSTVAVMVARGLMDLPIKRWAIFHGARIDDAHSASMALRKVTGDQQILAAVGYSMGAIVLSNYVARSGDNCPLDAAVAISGGLDMRYEHHFYRAQRLWQPMLAKELRDTFLVNKWGERVRARLSLEDMKKSMRASHVTEIDKHAVAPYNGYDSVEHYYGEMSALGDIPLDAYDGNALPENARIHSVAIPFCVVHAFDDPLSTWRTVAANEGLMHPTNLTANVKTGNLMILLTKAGGHVGWPLGWLPFLENWRWMNDVAMTFVEAVRMVSRQQGVNRHCTNIDGVCQDEGDEVRPDAGEKEVSAETPATQDGKSHDEEVTPATQTMSDTTGEETEPMDESPIAADIEANDDGDQHEHEHDQVEQDSTNDSQQNQPSSNENVEGVDGDMNTPSEETVQEDTDPNGDILGDDVTAS